MTPLEAAEWARNYQGTWVRVRGKYDAFDFPEWSPANLQGTIASDSDVLLDMAIHPPKGKPILVGSIPMSRIQVDTEFPRLGYFALNHEALYFEKRPERQWKRGMCSQNVTIFCPFSWYVSGLYSNIKNKYGPQVLENVKSTDVMGRLASEVVCSLYDRHMFPSLESASQTLLEGKAVSIPISYDLALSVAADRPELLLWNYIHPVASVHQNQVKMFQPMFRQEIQDHFQRMGRYDITVQ